MSDMPDNEEEFATELTRRLEIVKTNHPEYTEATIQHIAMCVGNGTVEVDVFGDVHFTDPDLAFDAWLHTEMGS